MLGMDTYFPWQALGVLLAVMFLVALFLYFSFKKEEPENKRVAIADSDDDDTDIAVGRQEGVQPPEKFALGDRSSRGQQVVRGPCLFQERDDYPI